jgi:uncharacterized protein (DUF433 family)
MEAIAMSQSVLTTTPLTEYFLFLSDRDIRVKGTRIGIEHILYEYIHNAKSPEEIAHLFPTVTLEQTYATILYYFQNSTTIGQYVSDWLDYTLKAEAAQDQDPAIQRLKQLKANTITA